MATRRIPGIENAYWLLARSDYGSPVAIDTEETFFAWKASSPASGTLDLMRASKAVGPVDAALVEDTDELISAIGELPCPEEGHNGSTIRELYVHGDCDVLAVALQRIIGGELYAVTDPNDPKGNAVRRHYLVHAGVYDGDFVYDIDGKTDADDWSAIWRENGGCVFEGDTGSITRRRLQSLQDTKHTPTELQRGLNIAWLIASLTGALEQDKLEELRAHRVIPDAL